MSSHRPGQYAKGLTLLAAPNTYCIPPGKNHAHHSPSNSKARSAASATTSWTGRRQPYGEHTCPARSNQKTAEFVDRLVDASRDQTSTSVDGRVLANHAASEPVPSSVVWMMVQPSTWAALNRANDRATARLAGVGQFDFLSPPARCDRSDREACWQRAMELEAQGLDRDGVLELLLREGWAPPLAIRTMMRLGR